MKYVINIGAQPSITLALQIGRACYICRSGIGICRRCIPMFLGCMSQIGIIKCACSMAEHACGKQSRSLGIYCRHMIPNRHSRTWAKRKTLFTISYKKFSGINTLIFKICAVEASHFYKGMYSPSTGLCCRTRDEHVAAQADNPLRAWLSRSLATDVSVGSPICNIKCTGGINEDII